MRLAPGAIAPLATLTGLVAALAARGPAADLELEQFEDRAVFRCTERAVRAVKSDRALWIKELEAAYPGRVANATTEEEYATWFVLVAGKGDEWRKDSVPNAQVGELFERVVQRMELGPVPSIRKDEFARYARRCLMPGNPPKEGAAAPDPNAEEADRVFRVLDRDGDGNLAVEELTLRLKDDKVRADGDGNGRINKDEYRLYFQRRVTVSVETAAAKAGTGEKAARVPDGKPAGPGAKSTVALPEWFASTDSDMDGQVALFEWRKAGRSLDSFTEMDLDGDGLLTRDEYSRFLKKVELDRPKTATPPKK
jgi:hypothetical protein